MSATAPTPFAVVGDRPAPNNQPPPPPADPHLALGIQMLLLATKTASQRMVTAVVTFLSASFTVAGVASVWWLWSRALPQPSVPQIVLCGLYAIFILAIEWQRRRK
jgi:hypothetical protein